MLRCFYVIRICLRMGKMNTDVVSKRVVIVGGSYYGNRGATLMLKNSIKKIRERLECEVFFDVWTEHIKENRKLCDDSDVNFIEFVPWKFTLIVLPLLLVCRILKKEKRNFSSQTMLGSCRNADLFFDISGISFIDDRKLIFLLYDSLVALPAIWLNKPIIKAAQAFGPFRNPLNRVLAKLILPRITRIYARGYESLLNLKKLGLTNIGLAADIGFYETTPTTIKNFSQFTNMKKPIIGISVSSVVYGKCKKMEIDYVRMLNEFIKYVVCDLKGSVILIPHAIRVEDNIKNNDIPIIKKILENSDSEDVHFFRNIEHPYELRQLISLCDFLLASRFHAMISSLSVGVPVIILGWSHKYQEVLKMFDLTDCYITFSNLNVESMISLFEQLFQRKSSLAKCIVTNIDKVRNLSDVNFTHIPELLLTK